MSNKLPDENCHGIIIPGRFLNVNTVQDAAGRLREAVRGGIRGEIERARIGLQSWIDHAERSEQWRVK